MMANGGGTDDSNKCDDYDHTCNSGDNYDPHHWQNAGLIPGSGSLSLCIDATQRIAYYRAAFCRIPIVRRILYSGFCIFFSVFCLRTIVNDSIFCVYL